MAIYKIFPSKDSSINSLYPQMNSGLDPILNVSNIKDEDKDTYISRVLIKFPQDEINKIIDDNINNSFFKTSLSIYSSESENIGNKSTIEVFPLYESWDNGNGMYNDTPLNNSGVSWERRDSETNWSTSSLPLYVNGGYGGTWFSSSNYSLNITPTQSFNIYDKCDIDVDVTDIIKVWYSSSKDINSPNVKIHNEGFLIKWDNYIEYNTSSIQPSISLYSVDTNTIYPPSLNIKWDDSVYSTGSLKVLSSDESYISIINNKGIFYPESIHKFRINSRPMYPPRTYQTSSLYTNNYCLPSSSYYAIKYLDSEEYIINFDEEFTKISCDASGSFFNIYFSGFEPEKHYSILIKTIIDGNVIIRENNSFFRIKNK